jgi:hypothetical protein
MRVFPNPAFTGSALKMALPFAPASVSVFDISGKLVSAVETPGPFFEWNAGNLGQGVYVIKAESGNSRFSEKLVIRK